MKSNYDKKCNKRNDTKDKKQYIDWHNRKDCESCIDFKNKADFVEVVYCKECSWSTERTKDNELFQYQCRNTVACGKPRRACDFCSYGERREK